MTNRKIRTSNWYPKRGLIITQLTGDLTLEDIEYWEKSLIDALTKIDDNSTFKIYVNLFGYNPINIDTHKRLRTIIPLTLADYGWKVGFLDLFGEESKKIKYSNTRGIQCVGMAYVHQDAVKMSMYETKFGSQSERFFTDPNQAKRWINNLKVFHNRAKY